MKKTEITARLTVWPISRALFTDLAEMRVISTKMASFCAL